MGEEWVEQSSRWHPKWYETFTNGRARVSLAELQGFGASDPSPRSVG